MYTAIGYAGPVGHSSPRPMTFNGRSSRADDVAIEILYCRVCHTGIH
ncbi:putative zinc-type alcohol dehydrogenase-like protein [Pseudomonas putida]|nr:putative zinc-type alcohol dehydrogenase-like protein [Pseudomonas sp. PvP089]MBP2091349.1 putative zinc-type alcohol dehydrogenase-like protein [Pseudomonas sp. PvP088]MBP2222488.1 putative zinc-type alcohol dehydrogenase-like protein [Pseudomonas putida]